MIFSGKVAGALVLISFVFSAQPSLARGGGGFGGGRDFGSGGFEHFGGSNFQHLGGESFNKFGHNAFSNGSWSSASSFHPTTSSGPFGGHFAQSGMYNNAHPTPNTNPQTSNFHNYSPANSGNSATNNGWDHNGNTTINNNHYAAYGYANGNHPYGNGYGYGGYPCYGGAVSGCYPYMPFGLGINLGFGGGSSSTPVVVQQSTTQPPQSQSAQVQTAPGRESPQQRMAAQAFGRDFLSGVVQQIRANRMAAMQGMSPYPMRYAMPYGSASYPVAPLTQPTTTAPSKSQNNK